MSYTPQITICGHLEVESVLPTLSNPVVVSIIDPEPGYGGYTKRPAALKNVRPLVVIPFVDVQDSHPQGPKSHLIAKVLVFLDKHKNRPILIHCQYGHSRSTALALMHMIYQKMDPTEAVAALHRIRPGSCPNIRIVRMISRHLKCHDAVMHALIAHPQIRAKMQAKDKHLLELYESVMEQVTAGTLRLPGPPIRPFSYTEAFAAREARCK
jgi:predicted protein tyrosine phosphatase